MMKAGKKWVVALVLLLLTSSSAFALGLGQVKVKSTLNEPLHAEIPIVSATSEELEDLKVSLASPQAYQRVGIKRGSLAGKLDFKVVQRDGDHVIVVSSDKPINEPVLDLLLELDWSSGKLLREYAILLSPAGMPAPHADTASVANTAASEPQQTEPAGESASPSQSATQSTTTGGSQSAETAASTSTQAASTKQRAAVQKTSASGSVAPGSTYKTRTGDSLWSIANRTSDPASVNRVMVAIQRANPDAFYQDNINALKEGAVLRVPGHDAIAQVGADEARDEVMQQNQAWRNPQAQTPSTLANAAATGSAFAQSGSGDAQASSGGHLELVPPADDDASGAGRGGVADGSGDAAVKGLKQDLQRAEEALASQKQHNKELQSRVDDLESIQDKRQHLLELKNAQIAELQDKLAAAGEPVSASSVAAAHSAAAPALAASTQVAEVASAGTSGAVEDDIFAPERAASVATASTSAAAVAASTALATPAESASAPMAAVQGGGTPQNQTGAEGAPDEQPAQQESGPAGGPVATPWYMQEWVWIVAAIIILILIFIAVRSRRGGTPPAEDASLADDMHAPDEDGVISAADSEDEQALRERVEQDPEDIEAHLELASLYYAYRDQDKFVAVAEAMQPHVGADSEEEWQQVCAMGEELCPDHALFAEAGAEAGAATADGVPAADLAADAGQDELPGAVPEENLDEDMSLVDMIDRDHGDSDASADASGAGEDEDGGYNFDFNLTPESERAQSDSSDETPTAPAADTDVDTDAGAADEDDPLGLSSMLGETPDDASDAGKTDAASPAADELGLADTPPAAADEDATPDQGLGNDVPQDDDDFSSDPVDTKLDLARAYQDMGDSEGARSMLDEVVQEGSEAQKDMARKLLDDLD